MFETFGKAHGRRETRIIEVTSVLEGYTDWPGARQFAKITRRRKVRGRTSREVEFYGFQLLTSNLRPPGTGSDPAAGCRTKGARRGVRG